MNGAGMSSLDPVSAAVIAGQEAEPCVARAPQRKPVARRYPLASWLKGLFLVALVPFLVQSVNAHLAQPLSRAKQMAKTKSTRLVLSTMFLFRGRRGATEASGLSISHTVPPGGEGRPRPFSSAISRLAELGCVPEEPVSREELGAARAAAFEILAASSKPRA
jgi:hypothetical protein